VKLDEIKPSYPPLAAYEPTLAAQFIGEDCGGHYQCATYGFPVQMAKMTLVTCPEMRTSGGHGTSQDRLVIIRKMAVSDWRHL